jgi:hypothetical protein
LQFKKTIDRSTFEKNLSGVKDAVYSIDPNTMKYINENKFGSNAFIYQALDMYLKELGFENVYSPLNLMSSQPSSLCNYVYVQASWKYNNKQFSEIILDFDFCNGESFPLISQNKYYDSMHSGLEGDFLNEFHSMYSTPKKKFDSSLRIKMPINSTIWTAPILIEYLQNNHINSLEGFYEGLSSDELMPKYKIGIVKNKEIFNIIYYSGAPNFEDWAEGENKGTIEYTAVPNIFKVYWRGSSKFNFNDYFLYYNNGFLTLYNDKEKYKEVLYRHVDKSVFENSMNEVPKKHIQWMQQSK